MHPRCQPRIATGRAGRAGRTGRAALLAAAVVTAVGAAGCADPAVRHQRDERRKLTDGVRSASAARRTAAERPAPWHEDKRPFDADRMDVEPYRAERRAGDGEGERLSHSRCLQVQDAYACPLLVHRWVASDVDGGVELDAPGSPRQVARLRDFVRCYHELGRHDPHDQSCLRQLRPVEVTGGYRGGRLRLRLVTPRPDRVEELRRRVRALLLEAR